MSINPALFSSKSDEWETPQDLFNELSREFHFNLDLAATKENTKCDTFCTKDNSGLDGLIIGDAFNIWCNPPYSQISKWVERCAELAKHVNVVVMLLPSRTDTVWFHKYIYNRPNVEIRFIKERLKFSNSRNSAPFPSMVVIFRKEENE